MPEANANSRLEAFCDAVFAIAMTLLVIDIRLPVTTVIGSNAEFWRALVELSPAIFAFLLSFVVIFIAWVSHHAALKLVNKSSGRFIYANGLMLLTVVFLPFPTALLGEYLWSASAAPAVVLYNAVLAVQAISWIALSGSAIRDHLANDAAAAALIRKAHRNGWYGVGVYTLLTVMAFWLPVPAAILNALTWVAWLVVGIRLKRA